MELKKLYEIANKEHIDIINFKMKNKAIIGYYNNYCIIGLNYSKIHSYKEEKCILAEELGHYYYSAYYTVNSDQEFIDKQEYRAMKWKSLACVPLKSILSCFMNGIYNLWDIAEKLNVDTNMVEFAINYYKENDLLKTNAYDSI